MASSSPPIDELAEPTRFRRGAMFSGDMADEGFPSPEVSIPPTPPRREGACTGKKTATKGEKSQAHDFSGKVSGPRGTDIFPSAGAS